MLEDFDVRRRRAAYRAAHRGTKEMDILLGRYAEAKLAAMDEDELQAFEALLGYPDPELTAWILDGTAPADLPEHLLVSELRAFHGLAASRACATT
ncbi:MAG: succinate dehydrogenase assembly factor 2 [Hyphomicrobiaceae bacterium]|nr:succinate dehydrogenase assembly factor 2 [Hyphomicrobiaceae bacterium]